MISIPPQKNPLFALSCLLQGIQLLSHPQLRKYLLIPLFINIVLYSCAFVLGYHSVSAIIQQLLPNWLSWLNWVFWPLFFISFFIIGFFTFTLLANLIAAPYYSQLSAQVLRLISDQPQTITEQAWHVVFFGELRRLAYLLAWMLPLLVLFLIPVVNLIAPIIWSGFAFWAVSMEFMAYPLENSGLTFVEQKEFMQQTRWSGFCFGCLIGICLTLPVINLFIGQAAVIGATIYVDKLNAPIPADVDAPF